MIHAPSNGPRAEERLREASLSTDSNWDGRPGSDATLRVENGRFSMAPPNGPRAEGPRTLAARGVLPWQRDISTVSRDTLLAIVLAIVAIAVISAMLLIELTDRGVP